MQCALLPSMSLGFCKWRTVSQLQAGCRHFGNCRRNAFTYGWQLSQHLQACMMRQTCQHQLLGQACEVVAPKSCSSSRYARKMSQPSSAALLAAMPKRSMAWPARYLHASLVGASQSSCSVTWHWGRDACQTELLLRDYWCLSLLIIADLAWQLAPNSIECLTTSMVRCCGYSAYICLASSLNTYAAACSRAELVCEDTDLLKLNSELVRDICAPGAAEGGQQGQHDPNAVLRYAVGEVVDAAGRPACVLVQQHGIKDGQAQEDCILPGAERLRACTPLAAQLLLAGELHAWS